MKLLAAVLLAAGLMMTVAQCPNGCSGHGSCGKNAVCACWAGFQASDCSERVCPSANSWGMDASDPHYYEECAGKGVCNRKTGECECLEGYTGHACTRRECPNDCSGHGVCTLQRDLPNVGSLKEWDADRIQTCVCDGEFMGMDCSERACPYGDDPVTTEVERTPGASTYPGSTGARSITQEITFKIPYTVAGPFDGGAGSAAYTPPYPATSASVNDYAAMASDVFALYTAQEANGVAATGESAPSSDRTKEQFILKFRDVHNETWVTPAIGNVFDDTPSALESSVKRALESLPNFKLKSVEIEPESLVASKSTRDNTDWFQCTTSCAAPTTTFHVRYTPDLATGTLLGNQALLECPDAYGCDEPGCRPRVRMPYAVRYVGIDTEETIGTTNNVQPVNFNGDPYHAHQNRKIVLLTEDSDPRVPLGFVLNNRADNQERFDARIYIFVVDPSNGANDAQDLWYVKTGGYNNIDDSADSPVAATNYQEEVRLRPSVLLNADQPAFPSPSANYATVSGFTSMGKIPSSGYNKVAIPGIPGVFVNFVSSDMVTTDNSMRVFEIMYKLPTCTVNLFNGQGADTSYTLSNYVELQECSGRGSCNHQAGECECFEGYFGAACHSKMTVV